jgi:predicted deacylase
MQALDMVRSRRRRADAATEPFVARTSTWARAHESGMLRTIAPLGARVDKGDTLGFVDDPYTGTEHPVRAHVRGVVIGRTNLPIVHEGDAAFHIARFRDDVDEVAGQVESFHQTHTEDMAWEEPPIV